LDLQRDALTAAGCSRIFADIASGKLADRPQLAAILDYVRADDTLVLWRMDRMGRCATSSTTLNGLARANVGFS
jgi:DNA invertase Pin-like site-specific DNA recombinase